MLAQARLGRHAEAATAAIELAKKRAKDPSKLFRADCGYALCIDGTVYGKAADAITAGDREQQQQYADAALAALDQAVNRLCRRRRSRDGPRPAAAARVCGQSEYAGSGPGQSTTTGQGDA
jgi:hypothetical protein